MKLSIHNHLVVILSGPLRSFLVCCLHLIEFRPCSRGMSDVGSFITSDEQLERNETASFPIQAMFTEDHIFILIKFTTLRWMHKNIM